MPELGPWLERIPLRGRSLRLGMWLLALGLFGLALTVASHALGPPAPPTGATGLPPGVSATAGTAPAQAGGGAGPDPIRQAEAALEAKLAAVLSEVRGAGRVSVVVTLAGSDELTFARETQTSREENETRGADGALETSTQETSDERLALVQSGAGEAPVLTEARMPEVEGVLVVAEGAGDPTVRELLTRAVEVALALPRSRILVVPGGGK
ncbi:MAG: hypothetical protein IRZ11_00010 [Clostridia bacterium]|nr:hypothetical protein [Clostridia bacterium]